MSSRNCVSPFLACGRNTGDALAAISIALPAPVALLRHLSLVFNDFCTCTELSLFFCSNLHLLVCISMNCKEGRATLRENKESVRAANEKAEMIWGKPQLNAFGEEQSEPPRCSSGVTWKELMR